ncbi:MAG: 1-acyl-sn-glycerol-3-phosphate acyltransferase [Verrucomicrobia bacterium]|nr:1-acyl-sn-glycerol-3-phosphate acyltransferase [Verrucomicrobiota bacterium]
MNRQSVNVFYWITRALLRTALGAYFTRIERFHAERVPATGPVLFVSNHPNSLTDAFVIAASVQRKVHFVGTVQLFRLPLMRWLLSRCGVIAINRVADDPRAMRTVRDTFEACYKVLEPGGAIAIFPEGITHDDPQLKTVKTGAARMAVELDERHGGKSGLQIVPVGLTFAAKEHYRSEVLVNFGPPIVVNDFLRGVANSRPERIRALNAEIERRIQELILHLPQLEQARVVNAVKRLYFDRLLSGNRVIHEPVKPRAEELLLTQAIAQAVDYIYAHQPEQAEVFVRKLDLYERWMRRLGLADESVAQFPEKRRLVKLGFLWALVGLVAAPVAAYGWLHRWLPWRVVRAVIRQQTRQAKNQTRVSTTAIVSGLFSFTACYVGYVALFHWWIGWPWTVWYALSLPVSGLVAHYYAHGWRRFMAGTRTAALLLRGPFAARQLLARRKTLIAEIEAARWEVPTEALTRQPKASP